MDIPPPALNKHCRHSLWPRKLNCPSNPTTSALLATISGGHHRHSHHSMFPSAARFKVAHIKGQPKASEWLHLLSSHFNLLHQRALYPLAPTLNLATISRLSFCQPNSLHQKSDHAFEANHRLLAALLYISSISFLYADECRK